MSEAVKAKITISIIIPSFNYVNYLGQAVESVINQTYPHWELIIVEDGSSDGSFELAKIFEKKDRRIKVICHSKRANKGLAKSLRLGLSCVRSDWVVFLEADDWLEPNYLSEKLSWCYESNCGCILNYIKLEAEEGCDISWQQSYVPRVLSYIEEASHNRETEQKLSVDILKENQIPTFSCVMIKKLLLQKASWDTPVEQWLDWFLWVQLFQTTRVKVFPDKLTHWRIHKGSFNHQKSIRTYLRDYKCFRNAIRALLEELEISDKSVKMKILNSSGFLLLGRRFYLAFKSKGLAPVLSQILSRLGLKKI